VSTIFEVESLLAHTVTTGSISLCVRMKRWLRLWN
jgi:hypothetical protein